MNRCNRRFKVEWVKPHPWLHYSSTEDGAYCALFAPEDAGSQKIDILVNLFLQIGHAMFQSHGQCQYHHDSIAKMLGFKETFADPTRGVARMLNQEGEEQMWRNTTVMKLLMKCLNFCGKQGLPVLMHTTKVIFLSWSSLEKYLMKPYINIWKLQLGMQCTRQKPYRMR